MKKLSMMVNIAMAALIVLLMAGCADGVSYGSDAPMVTKGSSGFQISHDLVYEYGRGHIVANISGKPVRFAVILTNPNGEPEVNVIKSERMIAGSYKCDFDVGVFHTGKYVLTLKTFSPEKVVCEREINLCLNSLSVSDVTAVCTPEKNCLNQLTGQPELSKILVKLEKNGNLPIFFDRSPDITLSGVKQKCSIGSDGKDPIMMDQQITVPIQIENIMCGNAEWKTKYFIKGTLSYGDGKTINFEKEFTTPDNSDGNSEKVQKESIQSEQKISIVASSEPVSEAPSPKITNLRQLMTHKSAAK